MAISAQGDGARINANDARLTTYGDESSVAEARDGGSLVLRDVEVKSHGRNADGLSVSERDSRAEVEGSSISTSGNGSDGIAIWDGGKVSLERSGVLTSGDGSVGVSVSGKESEASLRGVQLATTGQASDALRVSSGGEAEVAYSRIKTSGNDADGVSVSGRASSAGTDRSVVATSGSRSTGVQVRDGGSAHVDDSLVLTRGQDSDGVSASGRDSRVTVDGSVVATSGRGSDGASVSDGASALLTQSQVATSGSHADGVSVSGHGSHATLIDSKVSTSGWNSDGVQVRQGGEAGVAYSSIHTSGNDADGVSVSGRASSVGMDRSVVATSGSNSTGVQVRDGGSAHVDDSLVLTRGQESDGVSASGRDSRVTVDGSVVATSGGGSTGVQVRDGGSAHAEDSLVLTRGQDSAGVSASGRGSRVTVDGSVIATSGRGSDGTSVSDGASAVLKQSQVATSALHADGVSVSGRGSHATLIGSKVSTSGWNSDGLVASQSASATIVRSDIQTSGVMSDAVSVNGNGSVTIWQSDLRTQSWGSNAIDVNGGMVAISGGTLETDGAFSDGIVVRNGGMATVDRGTVRTNGVAADGLSVQGTGSTALAGNTTISTAGAHSSGVSVGAGGGAVLSADTITTSGRQANGVSVSGQNAWAIVHGSDVTAIGAGAQAISVADGGKAAILGGSASAAGPRGTAVSVSGDESAVLVQGTTLDATGRDSAALRVEDGGTAIVADASIGVSGGGTNVGVSAQGYNSRALVTGSNVSISGHAARRQGGSGVLASDGARVAFVNGSVDATGDRNVALRADGGTVVAENSTLSTSGAKAAGVAAVSRSNGDEFQAEIVESSSRIALRNVSVSTSGNSSAGLLAAGPNSEIRGVSSTVSTSGVGSVGVAALNGGVVTLSNTTVTTKGAGTAGALVGGTTSDGDSAVSTLNVQGGSINATGADSAGILIRNSGKVNLANTTVSATGAGILSQVDKANQAQSITVGAGSTLVANNGTLLQVNRSAEGGSSKVSLDLQDGSITSGNVVDDLGVALTRDGGTYVTVGAKASYTGLMTGVRDVTTQGGDQSLDFSGGSTMENLYIDQHAVTSGGTVTNRINASGNVTVDDATLGGNWNIGGILTSTNGGIIRPGNSVGTITTTAIDWQPGTLYKAEINAAGGADLVQVTGSEAANISNTDLEVSSENGTGGYRLNHDYTILSAAGGVSGQFASAEWTGKSYPLIQLFTDYSPNAVAVRMGVNQTALAALDLTRNQRAASQGALSVVGNNETADATFFADNPAAAFSQVSGEVHADVRSLLLGDMLSTNTAILDHMRANLNPTPLPGQPLADRSSSVDAAALPTKGTSPLWAQFTADGQSMDGDGNASKTNYSSTRLLIGGDGGIGAGWRLGAAAGVSTGDFNVRGLSSTGNIHNYSLTMYGGNSWAAGTGRVNVLVGGGYTRHDISTSRTVALAGTQSLDADYHGSTWQLFGDVGYAIPWGSDYTVEPYANVTWLNQRMDSFDESGGSAALHGDSGSNNLAATTLGLRGTMTVQGRTNTFTVRGNIGWRHAEGDLTPESSLSFIQGGGSSFSVAGVPIARNSAVVGLSGELGMNRYMSMGLRYDGQFGSGNTDNAGSLYVKVRF
ncbi:autotransporter domain-containing protein [Bordetella bronchialis]|uniref:autotransporter domain-containing protein n=1 Tax=Bordetella bronchialis TaxID=463025 RepID=UPI003D03FFC7